MTYEQDDIIEFVFRKPTKFRVGKRVLVRGTNSAGLIVNAFKIGNQQTYGVVLDHGQSLNYYEQDLISEN